MAQPYLGQVQCFGFSFAPKFWALCNGQVMPLQQNAALFSLLGTNYGGDGTRTFALPNLQSRVPMHYGTAPSGNSYAIGEQAGEEQVLLQTINLPAHSHSFMGSTANAGVSNADPGEILATSFVASGTAPLLYGPPTATTPLNPLAVLPVGNNLPHENRQPYLTLNWCIALAGTFPSRN